MPAALQLQFCPPVALFNAFPAPDFFNYDLQERKKLSSFICLISLGWMKKAVSEANLKIFPSVLVFGMWQLSLICLEKPLNEGLSACDF